MRNVRSAALIPGDPGGGAGASTATRAPGPMRRRRRRPSGAAPRPAFRRRGRRRSPLLPCRAARVRLVRGDLLVEAPGPRVDVGLVLVVAAPPRVRRALRVALGRVLPLLLATERRDVHVAPRAAEVFVAPIVDEVGPEDP